MTDFDEFICNTYLDILIERLPDGHPNYISHALFDNYIIDIL